MRAHSGIQRAVERDAAPIPFGPNPERIGIVFVHGIGEQPENDAIREFGGYLLKWLREWHAAHEATVAVQSSVLTYGDHATAPARFTLEIPASEGSAPQTWVLAEAWWAARLRAPNLLTMVRWAWLVVNRILRRLSNSVWRNITGEYGDDKRTFIERAIRTFSAAFLLVGYAAARILAVPFITLLFLLAQLPGPFERAVLTLRGFLVDQIGDFYTFLCDDIQALHIRNAVTYSIKYLVQQERCDRIVVMAHSQGTVVSFDALCADKIPEIGAVTTFITVGAALNNAWELNPRGAPRLEDDLPPHIRWLDVWADYDPASGGPLVRTHGGQVGEDLQVLNGLNVLTDHGGYFTNREEFLSRLAQEIDSPKGKYKQSRYFPGEPLFGVWRRRRRDRVLTMVVWRLAAFGVFGYIVLQRIQPPARLPIDGLAAWEWLGRAPVVGGMVDALRSLGTLLGLGPPASDVLAGLVGLAVWAAVYTTFFVVLYALLFSPWHDAEGLRSVTREARPPSQRGDMIVRSALVLVSLVAGAMVIADLPPLPRPSP